MRDEEHRGIRPAQLRGNHGDPEEIDGIGRTVAPDLEKPVRSDHERARRERAEHRPGKVQKLPRLREDRLPGDRVHGQKQTDDQPAFLQRLLPVQSGLQIRRDQRVRFKVQVNTWNRFWKKLSI